MLYAVGRSATPRSAATDDVVHAAHGDTACAPAPAPRLVEIRQNCPLRLARRLDHEMTHGVRPLRQIVRH